MRGRQEHLNCKVQDFKDQGNYYEHTERLTKASTGETDDPKARRKYNNKIFRGNCNERDPYAALKKYLSHRPEGIDEFYLQPIDSPKENIWYKTAHEEGRPGKHNETNGRESRDQKRR